MDKFWTREPFLNGKVDRRAEMEDGKKIKDRQTETKKKTMQRNWSKKQQDIPMIKLLQKNQENKQQE